MFKTERIQYSLCAKSPSLGEKHSVSQLMWQQNLLNRGDVWGEFWAGPQQSHFPQVLLMVLFMVWPITSRSPLVYNF